MKLNMGTLDRRVRLFLLAPALAWWASSLAQVALSRSSVTRSPVS